MLEWEHFGKNGNSLVSRLLTFKNLYMAFRREVLRLSYARRSGSTPFFDREVSKFKAEVEAPMDAAWRALPPTEREMFLKGEAKQDGEVGNG